MNTIILSVILSIILILIFIMFGLGRKTQDVKLQETVNVSPPCKEMSLKAYKYEFKELIKKDYYVFVDVLTIDGNYTENQIIELAYIRVNRKTGRITETYTTFVRPYRLERLHSVHGKLESAPLAKDVATKLETAFADAVVIGYNMFATIGSIVAMGYIAGAPLDVRMFDVYEEMDRDHREPLSIDVQQTACSFGYQKHSDNRLLDNCYACEFLLRQLIHDHKNI